MSKISQHFFLQDFLPKNIYDLHIAGKINGLWFISPQIVAIEELIWERFQKQVIINTWKDGGSLHYRGFRDDSYYYNADGSKKQKSGFLSQHRLSKASDSNVVGVTVEEVYNDIVKNFDIYKKAGLTTLENITATTGAVANDMGGWVHKDIRTTTQDTVLIVNP